MRLTDLRELRRDPGGYADLLRMAWEAAEGAPGALIGAIYVADLANPVSESFASRLSEEACEPLRGNLFRVGRASACLAGLEIGNKVAKPGLIEVRFHNALAALSRNVEGEVGEPLAACFVCEAAYFARRFDTPTEELLPRWFAALDRGLLS